MGILMRETSPSLPALETVASLFRIRDSSTMNIPGIADVDSASRASGRRHSTSFGWLGTKYGSGKPRNDITQEGTSDQ